MNLIITNTLPFHLEENRTNLVSSSDDTLFPLVLERLKPVGRGLPDQSHGGGEQVELGRRFHFFHSVNYSCWYPQVLGGLRVVWRSEEHWVKTDTNDNLEKPLKSEGHERQMAIPREWFSAVMAN